ncbi:MAG TPA: hypothetical protein VLY23_13305 [Candidatus Acidoferrum sp.]|nr:hypothetical protein [Candidatus Acidoferrum sp.]
MRKAILGSFAVLAVAALVWASSDPWKDKPYQQWDQKDVQHVLSNSPWAKTVQVDAKSSGADLQASQGGLPQGSSAGGGSMGGGGGRPGGGGGGMGGSQPPEAGGGAGGSDMGGGVPQIVLSVRWLSSRTMREAFLRGAVLSGSMKEEDAEKQAAQPVDTYQVIIAGPNMTPFRSIEENAIKEKATLTTKKDKQKIEAAKVDIQRSPDGQTIRSIVIFFPKKSATGEATIAADEKGAEFSLAVAGVSIKTGFDFSKMYDAQGRDL